jgi:hypothetical protein
MKKEIFTKQKIIHLLKLLSQELEKRELKGEILIVGGSAMVIAFKARIATKDIDAIFEPKSKIHEISKKIAEDQDLPENWLNDAVKGFMSEKAEYNTFLDLPALKVYIPIPGYIFAMKAISMRITPESSDIEDLKLLIRIVKIKTVEEGIDIIKKYYPEKLIPQKTYYALDELINTALVDNKGDKAKRETDSLNQKKLPAKNRENQNNSLN